MHIKYVGVIALGVYVGTIVAANWMTTTFGLVAIGFSLFVTAGTFAAGLALVARDAVQVTWGRIASVVAVIVGAVISYVIADPFIALASGVAFLVSEIVDFGVFTPLMRRGLSRAVIISSVVSAPVDTILFLHIAGFGVTWQAVLGQFLVKTALALIAAVIIKKARR